MNAIEDIHSLLEERHTTDRSSRLLDLLSSVKKLDRKTLGTNNDCLHCYVRNLHQTSDIHIWESIVDILIDHGYNIDNQDHLGQTPLLAFINFMSFDLNQVGCKIEGIPPKDVVAKLLRCGASVNISDHNGNTPLYSSVSMLNMEITMMILAAGGSLNSVLGGNIFYALGKAYNNDDKTSLMMMRMMYLVKDRVDIREQCIDGSTILHYAASNCMENFLRFLISCTDIDTKSKDSFGRNILHYAVRNKYSHTHLHESVKMLDVNERDINADTPLHFACLDQNLKAVKDLLEWGADPNTAGSLGIRPLHLYCPPLKSAANPYSNKWHTGRYTLSLDAMADLLKYKADVNAVDNYGSTALHYLAFTGCSADVINLLVDAGAVTSLQDNNGTTAAETAAKQCHWQTAKLLGSKRCPRLLPQSDIGQGVTTIHGIETYTDYIRNSTQRPDSQNNTRNDYIFADIGLHTTTDNLEANRHVLQKVEEYFQNVVSELVNLDKRFEGTLICSGSSYEGTKTGNPDEFDYMVNLVAFSKLIRDLTPFGSTPAFIELVVGDDIDPRFEEFVFGGKLYGPAIQDRFRMLTWQAMCKVNQKGTDNIYCPYDDWFGKLYPPISYHALPNNEWGSSGLQAVTLIWTCGTYKRMKISIDLNPVVHVQLWPQNFRPQSRLLSNLQEEGFYVIPKTISVRTEKIPWRISLSHIETKIFKVLPPSVLEAYRLIKTLRESPITPIIINGNKKEYHLNRRIQLRCTTMEAPEPVDIDELLKHPESWPSYYLELDSSAEVETFYLKQLFYSELDEFASQGDWPREIDTQEQVCRSVLQERDSIHLKIGTKSVFTVMIRFLANRYCNDID